MVAEIKAADIPTNKLNLVPHNNLDNKSLPKWSVPSKYPSEKGKRNLSLVLMTSGSFNGNNGLKNETTKIIINKIPPNKASLFLEINFLHHCQKLLHLQPADITPDF